MTPQTAAHQAPPSLGFSRQEHWSGLSFPSPGDLPDPGIEPRFSALQAHALPSDPPGKPRIRKCFQYQHVIQQILSPYIWKFYKSQLKKGYFCDLHITIKDHFKRRKMLNLQKILNEKSFLFELLNGTIFCLLTNMLE